MCVCVTISMIDAMMFFALLQISWHSLETGFLLTLQVGGYFMGKSGAKITRVPNLWTFFTNPWDVSEVRMTLCLPPGEGHRSLLQAPFPSPGDCLFANIEVGRYTICVDNTSINV